jgi:hypothetical protein
MLLFVYVLCRGMLLVKQQEPAEDKLSVDTISKERAQALDLAYEANRLLDKKYFDDFAKAVSDNNPQLFYDTCDKAGIDKKLGAKLWLMFGRTEKMKPKGW